MKSYKKALFASGILVIGVLSVLVSHIAFARDEQVEMQISNNTETAPVILNINSQGNVILRGKITAVTANSVTVKSWGTPWTVQVTPATTISSQHHLISDFKAGDFVGVQGTVNESDFIITARIVREWGVRPDHDNDGLSDKQDNDDDNDHILDSHDVHPFDHDNNGTDDEGVEIDD